MPINMPVFTSFLLTYVLVFAVTTTVSTLALYPHAVFVAATLTQHLVVADILYPSRLSALPFLLASRPAFIHSTSRTLSFHPCFMCGTAQLAGSSASYDPLCSYTASVLSVMWALQHRAPCFAQSTGVRGSTYRSQKLFPCRCTYPAT